jgi:parvulin-like peptidyl-prolyl isomerase
MTNFSPVRRDEGWVVDRQSFTADPARRTLWLGAFGAVFGLVLGGYALFTASGTATRAVPPEDVALVNGRPILQSDFVTQVQAETGGAFKDASPADRRRVLQEMIDEELLVQRGLDVDLAASDPDVRSAMVAGVNLQVDAEILASRPDEAALRAYYAAHRDRYAIDGSMDVRDLVFYPGAGADAAEAAKALADARRQGVPVDTAATKAGFSDSRRLGHGDNYDFGVKAKLGVSLYQAAAALSDGGVSPPLVEDGVVHVLVMLHRTPIRQLAFDAARDQVFQDFQRDARASVEHQNLDFLRSRAEIHLGLSAPP